MNKVAYNGCFGGFGLSDEAEALYLKRTGVEYDWTCPRHDSTLIEIIEELGERANGACADLRVIEIKGNMYRIEQYDGSESVNCPEYNQGWTTIEEGE